MIKKVSNSQSNSYEIPGAKFAPVACNWTTCELQCNSSCNYWSTQFYNASNYYQTHNDIWN